MSEEIKIEDTNDITSDDKLWALLGYIFGIIAVLALLLEDKKNRPFLKYHAINAILLWAVIFVTSWLCGLGIIVWIYAIYLGIKAYGGDWVEVPVVTDFAKKQGWL
jgi:uncharacterized membrane protein